MKTLILLAALLLSGCASMSPEAKQFWQAAILTKLVHPSYNWQQGMANDQAFVQNQTSNYNRMVDQQQTQQLIWSLQSQQNQNHLWMMQHNH